MMPFAIHRKVAAVIGSVFFTTLLVSPYDAAELGRLFLGALQAVAQEPLVSLMSPNDAAEPGRMALVILQDVTQGPLAS